MIDTHAHLDDPQFDADRDAVLQRSRLADVDTIVCVGTTLASSRAAVRLAETCPGGKRGQSPFVRSTLWAVPANGDCPLFPSYPDVYAAVGIHPNSSAKAGPDDWDQVAALLDHPRVVALGETGLDRYRDFAPLELQRDYFRRHLVLGRRRDLPLVIHCRDAWEDLLPLLREFAAGGAVCGVLHAFSGDAATLAECIALGLHVSFAGNVTYTNKKFQSLRAAAAAVPPDRLLVETDSPYLVPEPLRGRQKRNEPALLVHTASALAALRGVTPETFAAQTAENARRLFRIAP
jgi:TatD DNase family protein